MDMKKSIFKCGWLCVVTVLLAIIFLGSVATKYLGEHAKREVFEEAESSVTFLSRLFKETFDEAETVSRLLSESPEILAVLIDNSSENIKNVNKSVDRHSKYLDNSICYLMNLDGEVIVSSNRDDKASFLGKNYKFRSYFKESIESGSGNYFALGITSQKRGFYSGTAVKDHQGNTIGVAVIKRNIEEVGENLTKHTKFFFVDKNGIVFIASNPEFLYKSLWKLDKKKQEEIIETKQFGIKPFESIFDDRFKGKYIIKFQGSKFFVSREHIGLKGWSVVLLTGMDRVFIYRLVGIAVTFFLVILILGFSLAFRLKDKSTGLIQEAKDYAELIFKVIPSAIFTVDKDKKVTSWNKKAEEITGYSYEDIIGKNCIIFADHPCGDKCSLFSKEIDKPITGGECRIKTKDGQFRSISKNVDYLKDQEGNIIGGIESFEDVTERKIAEDQMRKLSSAIEQSPSVVAITDLDGNLEYVNPKFTELNGYTLDEVRGQNPRVLKSGEQPTEVYKDMWDKISKGESVTIEFHNKKKNGDLYWEIAALSAIRDVHGDITHYLKVAEDITERKQYEEELQKTKEELENQAWGLQKTNQAIKSLYKDLEAKNSELQKLDQLKSDFVSTVSHELRTPLAISTEGINLILDGIVGDITDKQKDLLKTSKNNLVRLNTIINDLLDISKIESGKITLKRGLVNLKDVLSQLAEAYKKVLDTKKQILNVKFEFDEIIAFVDSDKMIQVITNFLNNAHKFTADEGEIELFVKVEGEEVICGVKDNGVGISEEDMPKLFTKFTQFDRTSGPGIKGTGLGLAICKALIEVHEGRIWAESNVGEGTTFFIALPSYQTSKASFDRYIEEIIYNTRGQNIKTSLAVLQLSTIGGIKSKHGTEKSIDVTNKVLETLSRVVSRPLDKIILYSTETIYIALPETDRRGGVNVLANIKNAFSRESFGLKDKSELEINYGLAVYPDNGNNKDDLIEFAFKEKTRQKRLLVVDDHPQIGRILKPRLKSRNIEMSVAFDGEEALRVIEKDPPDIIVLDIVMPNMNGYEVLGRLKENPSTAFIPVIILTAKNISDVRSEYSKLGDTPVLQKTGGFESLVNLIIEMI
ncbi:MAG: PAS domain S-box protein [Candidatus Zapsychrus exili]|nr:PAS domain S-box protein [Candidatus Zapsychrus exili]